MSSREDVIARWADWPCHWDDAGTPACERAVRREVVDVVIAAREIVRGADTRGEGGRLAELEDALDALEAKLREVLGE